MARDYVELTALQARLKEGIAELFPDRFWVRGEISQWSPRQNGHCYFSLSESKGGKVVAEMRAMIWKWHLPSIQACFEEETGQALEAGMTVLVRVQVNYSELYGVTLFIDDIDPAFTLGEKALERRKAIEKLTAEGYMEMQQELCLPLLPGRLAVISSPTAAGWGDFLHHLEAADYGIRADLFEAVMQGDGAPESIISALEEAQEQDYDAVLILRGGGSELDLACFDDYDLAVAIATCPLPVLTAIGHDRDHHIADMVANRFVKTPTALADVFIDLFATEDERVAGLGDRVVAEARRRVQSAEQAAEGLFARIRLGLHRGAAAMEVALQQLQSRIGREGEGRVAMAEAAVVQIQSRIRRGVDMRMANAEGRLRDVQSRVSRGSEGRVTAAQAAVMQLQSRVSRGMTAKWHAVAGALGDAVQRLRFSTGAIVGRAQSEVALKEARIASADPRTILSRGYVLVTDERNKVLKTVEHVRIGDRIGVRFSDGALRANVSDVFREEEDRDQSATA